MTTTTPTIIQKIEERFEPMSVRIESLKEVDGTLFIGIKDMPDNMMVVGVEELKSTFRSSLKEYIESLEERMRGMKLEMKHRDYCSYNRPGCDCGYEDIRSNNTALDAVLAGLEEDKKALNK